MLGAAQIGHEVVGPLGGEIGRLHDRRHLSRLLRAGGQQLGQRRRLGVELRQLVARRRRLGRRHRQIQRRAGQRRTADHVALLRPAGHAVLHRRRVEAQHAPEGRHLAGGVAGVIDDDDLPVLGQVGRLRLTPSVGVGDMDGAGDVGGAVVLVIADVYQEITLVAAGHRLVHDLLRLDGRRPVQLEVPGRLGLQRFKRVGDERRSLRLWCGRSRAGSAAAAGQRAGQQGRGGH